MIDEILLSERGQRDSARDSTRRFFSLRMGSLKRSSQRRRHPIFSPRLRGLLQISFGGPLDAQQQRHGPACHHITTTQAHHHAVRHQQQNNSDAPVSIVSVIDPQPPSSAALENPRHLVFKPAMGFNRGPEDHLRTPSTHGLCVTFGGEAADQVAPRRA